MAPSLHPLHRPDRDQLRERFSKYLALSLEPGHSVGAYPQLNWLVIQRWPQPDAECSLPLKEGQKAFAQ